MKELQLLLKRFLAREIGIDDLQNKFSLLLEHDEELPNHAAAWLAAGEKDGLLSTAVCSALKTVLVSHMASASIGPSPADSGIFGELDTRRARPDTAEQPRGDEPDAEANATFIRDPDATALGADLAESAATSTDGPPQIGSIIGGRYELLSEVGSGGMGRVYMARDRLRAEAQDRNPHVALKMLSEEFRKHPDSMIALQREVQRAQKLAHPNVITVHEFFRDGPHLYMTMELLEGKALDQLIQSELSGGIPYEKAWPIIEGMCHALQYGHDKGIVHCDIKPGNVFVCNDGTIKVLDLGISRPMISANTPNAELTAFDPGTRLGSLTPAYASLEMWYQDTPDPRDDVYALACVAYVLLSGKHPFDGQSAREAKKLKLVPEKIDSITRGQWAAIAGGLEIERANRTESIDKFRRQMEPQAVVRRNRRYAAAIGAVAIIILGSIGMRYYTLAVEEGAMEDRGGLDQPMGPQVGGDPSVERPELSAEEREELDSLLSLAEIQFAKVSTNASADELSYVLSLGPNNVMQLTSTVLAIDPGYEDALQAKQRVFDLYVSRARQFEDDEVFEQALALTQFAEEVMPNTATVLRLQRSICANAPSACASQ